MQGRHRGDERVWRHEEEAMKRLDEQQEAGGEEAGEGGDDLRAAGCNLPHTPVAFIY